MADNEPKRIPLDQFLTAGYKAGFGMTREEAWEKGVCVECKKPPTFYSEAGRNEYRLSGMCEPCFDDMFKEEE